MSLVRKLKDWSPVLFSMAFIFWMSSGTFSPFHTSRFIEPLLHFLFPGISPEMVDLIHCLVRKSGHLMEYFILGVLLFRAFRSDSAERLNRKWVYYSVVLIVIYAFGDEFHQSFVSVRTSSLWDVVIDIVGGVLAQAASVAWQLRHQRPQKNQNAGLQGT